ATTTHSGLPHPYDRAATPETLDEFAARAAELAAGDRLSEDEFSRRAAKLVEPMLGVVAELTERDFAQLPVHVSRATVADPVRLLGTAPRPVVYGSGPDFASARY